jgi:Uma2 family endonuclease
MNTPSPVRKDGKFSVEEFFALIESRPEEERRQLIDGEAMSLPRPTLAHQRIASNLAYALNAHFRMHCPGDDLHAYFRIGLTVPGAELFRPQADVAVLGGMADYESYADRFYFVAEVLSDSNTDKDIAVKRQRYLQHPDNLYFLLLEQKQMRAELMARASGWEPIVLDNANAILALPEWNFRVEFGALYRGTPLAPA